MEAEFRSETFQSANTEAQRRHAEKMALRQQAAAALRETRHAAFITLVRERGGINARNREQIEAEAEAAGRAAAEAVYFARGYKRCTDPHNLGCLRLASPGFGACPFCTLNGD